MLFLMASVMLRKLQVLEIHVVQDPSTQVGEHLETKTKQPLYNIINIILGSSWILMSHDVPTLSSLFFWSHIETPKNQSQAHDF